VLAAGLADNWSQVRYAASIAARALLLALPLDELQLWLGTLLPRLLLNRKYVAEGVRRHAEESWRLLIGNSPLFSFLDPTATCHTPPVQYSGFL